MNVMMTRISVLVLLLVQTALLNAQNTLVELYRKQTPASVVEFVNTPVLFKENGRQAQQILAAYTAVDSGKISFSLNGRELLSASLKKGNNRLLLTVPATSRPKKISLAVKIDGQAARKYPFTLLPAEKMEVLLIQHTHTDIGYTRPQSEVLAEQMRYIDYALDFCDQTDSLPDDAKFRWTCEAAWVTREYLRSRPEEQIDRLKKRIAEGRIEVTGMYFNMAEVADENIMYDFLQPLKEFHRAGIPVKTAMQNDVNGIAWCMPDYFKHTGVKYLNMGINETRSILPFDKPTAFWWEAPSGERLLAFRAEHYMTGNFFGIESAAPDFGARMMWYLADLKAKKYPLDKVAVQYSGYFTDNAPPSTVASTLVRDWNNKYESPKLRLAVVGEFFEYLEKQHGASLPVYRNAWLDWWTDGFASISRETAEVRKTQNLKQAGEGLFAMITTLGGELNPRLEEQSDHISENALFFDEHTVGADESISRPYSENTTRQWLQKGAYAWEALKKVTLVNEEALARFQPFLRKPAFPVVYILNSMGWDRSGTAEVFIDYEVFPIDRKARMIDLATGEEVPVQLLHKRREGAYWILEVKDIPAMGYKALRIEVSDEPPVTAQTSGAPQSPVTAQNPGAAQTLTGIQTAATTPESANAETLENKYYRIQIDKATGGITSLFDKELGQELADPQQAWKIGQPVRETLPARNKLEPSHTTVQTVTVGEKKLGPVWTSISLQSEMQGYRPSAKGTPGGIRTEIRLYHNEKKIEFLYAASKEMLTDPEALYIAFPFQLPDSRIVFETIGGILSFGEQLPGSSSDWNVAQNFVAVRGSRAQIIMVSNELPLWQFGGLNIGKFERYPKPGKPWLFSWVMNNYWFTNFRAFQEGDFSWSYQLTSVTDTSNTYATKYAWGQRTPFLSRALPAGTEELTDAVMRTLQLSGDPNAMLVNARPAFGENREAILLHFRELEGKPATVALSSAVEGRPIKTVREVNVTGQPVGAALQDIRLKPFEVKFVEVAF